MSKETIQDLVEFVPGDPEALLVEQKRCFKCLSCTRCKGCSKCKTCKACKGITEATTQARIE